MKRYLITFGTIIIVLSILGGALYLSSGYDEYQSRIRALGAGPVTLYDLAKWQFARILGTAMIVGGAILGSMLMALGWIVKTLEQIHEAMTGEPAETPAASLPMPASQDFRS
jgi:hypothetical protein